jgi:hypothetical protein
LFGSVLRFTLARTRPAKSGLSAWMPESITAIAGIAAANRDTSSGHSREFDASYGQSCDETGKVPLTLTGASGVIVSPGTFASVLRRAAGISAATPPTSASRRRSAPRPTVALSAASVPLVLVMMTSTFDAGRWSAIFLRTGAT